MTDPTVSIRPIATGDRAGWQRLFLAYGDFYETHFDAPVLDGVWSWLMDATHPVRALVAVTSAPGDDGTDALSGAETVIGFAHYRPQPDTFTAASGWFLDDLYTDPAHRGSGAATLLIRAIEAEAAAAGGGTLRWITADDNERAQRVYDRIATRARWVTYEIETGR